MNKNFLNNQNYILGKSEKKKLLSKFFVENSFLSLYLLLSSLKNKIDYLKLSILIIISIFTIIPFLVYTSINPILIFIVYLSIIFIINIIFSKNKVNLTTIDNISIKNFFISKEINFFTVIFLFGFILVSFIFLYSRYSYYLNNSDYYLYGLYIIIGLGIYFHKITIFILKFNILQIIIMPLYFIFMILNFIITFIYIFIIRGIKGYTFIKFFPKTRFLKKFKNLDKKRAKNEFYEVIVRG